MHHSLFPPSITAPSASGGFGGAGGSWLQTPPDRQGRDRGEREHEDAGGAGTFGGIGLRRLDRLHGLRR